MALTRKLLKGMGLTDEQVDTIIEAHTDTVDGLKADVSKYKTDAEKLSDVQKELDELKAKGDDGWKEKHDKLKGEFDTYKGWEHEAEKTIVAAKKQTLRHEIVHAFFDESGLTESSNTVETPWARNEEMVEWISIQGEKIYKAWHEADAL